MKIALITMRGGHLTEILRLLDAFDRHEYFFVIPHSVHDQELLHLAPVVFSDDLDTNIVRFLKLTLWSIGVVRRERPDVILSMGPHIALPFFLWGKVLGIKTIYIESWCRVENLSLTGRIAYLWVDEFWVQWPQLQAKYPRAKYKGAVI